ncbi:efflux RND transporter periplasmic adaptor subunit [Leptolyngbya boryana CZ1]|uniref:Efflux RND transporter periplasmic adaptor subunit n=1 Tax=Leptolyngbya boryana CZ1 TaxID=3060204 RepID=A0AA97ASK0_LEPBY|nr:efflux RND transporter periplasmic adaptor subunit [Leptolyngbya boryana]WNZ47619.1 efflux RND transporter periplasmic adaptor subunit [Leptolyngbya boryana CZ1]
MRTVTVERTDTDITISANGTVQPAQSVNVSPKSSGVLKQLLVKEGDQVEAGQVLAYMDDSNFQGQLMQAQAQVASAQANVTKLESGNRPQEIAQAEAQLAAAQANLDKLVAGNRPQEIAQSRSQLAAAEANLQQAELNFNQNQRLFGSGALSQRELDTSRTALATARAQVEQAKQATNLQQTGTRPEDIEAARAQVEQLKQALSLQKEGARSEDIEAARAQLMNAQGQLKTVQTQINDTIIRAPFRGVVTRKFADPGSFVTPTTSSSDVSSATSSSILALAATNQIVAKVPETSIPRIKVGQTVTIEADAFPGKSFKGTVVQVANQSTVDQNVTNFEVKSAIDDRDNQLQAGMNVNVKFNVGKLENALVVPTVAIVRRAEGTGVLLAGQDRPRFQKITTGALIDDKTVVESGVKEGDRVLLSFPQGERPTSRTPSVFPGAPGGGAPGGGSRRGGG